MGIELVKVMATETLSSEFRDGTYKCAKCGEVLYLYVEELLALSIVSEAHTMQNARNIVKFVLYRFVLGFSAIDL